MRCGPERRRPPHRRRVRLDEQADPDARVLQILDHRRRAPPPAYRPAIRPGSSPRPGGPAPACTDADATSRTIASRSGRGSPSMLNSISRRRGARNAAIAVHVVAAMCRSSARGWTVMPGAPASTQTPDRVHHGRQRPAARVAQGRDLVDVDAELRMRTVHYSEMQCLTLSAISSRPALDLLLILAFDHHAQQRLGARVAHQQAPLAGERALRRGPSRRRSRAPRRARSSRGRAR